MMLGDVGIPLFGRDGAKDDIHLFERLSLGFREEECEDEHATDVDRGEGDEHLPTERGVHKGRDF